jgi:hypothetical protein
MRRLSRPTPSGSISGLSPADASESVDAGDFVKPADMPVPPTPPLLERGSDLDRKRVAGEARKGFDNRRVVKHFGRQATHSTDAALRESRP